MMNINIVVIWALSISPTANLARFSQLRAEIYQSVEPPRPAPVVYY